MIFPDYNYLILSWCWQVYASRQCGGSPCGTSAGLLPWPGVPVQARMEWRLAVGVARQVLQPGVNRGYPKCFVGWVASFAAGLMNGVHFWNWTSLLSLVIWFVIGCVGTPAWVPIFFLSCHFPKHLLIVEMLYLVPDWWFSSINCGHASQACAQVAAHSVEGLHVLCFCGSKSSSCCMVLLSAKTWLYMLCVWSICNFVLCCLPDEWLRLGETLDRDKRKG